MGILFLGLSVAILCYPFLHEVGHAIATILCGAKIREFRLLPTPYTLCDMHSMSVNQQCLIGISGMLFPFFISLIIKSEFFWIWLVSLIIKAISLLSFAISYLAVLCYETGIVWLNEDIVKVVQITTMESSIWLLFLFVMVCFSVYELYQEKPSKRIKDYFGL